MARHTKPTASDLIVNWQHPISSGLRVWFPFNEFNRTRRFWQAMSRQFAGVSQPNNATLDWVGSPHGGAVLLQGNQFVFTFEELAEIDGKDFTIIAWLYQTTRTGDQTHVYIGDGSGFSTEEIAIGNEDGQIPRILFNTSDVVSLPDYTVGAWHQVAYVKRTGVGIFGYVDGKLQGSDTSIDDNFTSVNYGVRIGSGAVDIGQEFLGAIDDVKIWNRALSEDEVKLLYADPYCNVLRPRYGLWAAGIPQVSPQMTATTLAKRPSGWNVNPAHPMAAKLLGWWPLHEGNGSSVTDQVTKVRTPINLPSPTTNWGSSPLGGALYLAANFECITNLPAMDQLIGAGDLTWSCRFMVDSLAAERHLLYLGDVGGVTNCMSLYVTAGGVLTFLCSNASSANTTHGVTIQTGSWYHVAVTRTGTTAQIYLQGAPNTAATDANYGVSIGSHHVVGATRIGASAWSGGISDVRLYNRVLSQPDIEMLLTDPYALLHRPDRLAMRGFAAIPLARPQHPRFELRTVGALVDYAQPVSRGLRAWWPISQGNGRDIRDIGPRNMTNSTAVIAYLTAWTGSAHGGSALKFEGAQNLQWSHATFTASLSSDGQSPWSTSAWIRPDEGLADGQYQILGKQVGSVNFSGWGLYVEVIGGSYRLGYTHRSTLEVRLCVTTESGTLVPGAWHHVVSAFDGSGAAAGVDLYINGARKVVLTESDTLGASTTNSGAAFIIGSRDTNGLFFQGLINQVRLYHRKLTREEAEAIYHDPWAGTHAPRYRHLLSGSEGVLLTTPDRHPHMAKPRPVLDPQVLKQGGSSLVAWWPFNEGGGSTTQDQHGQRHVATLTNMDGTAWVGTLHGGGLQFGGTDDYLSVPMHASLQPLRLTLAVWVRLDARPLTFASVIEAGDATTDGWSLVVDHTGAFGFVMKTAGGSQAGGYNQPRQLGHWTHVALTYNGESGGDALYIDGQPVAIGSLTALSRSDQGGVLAAPASALTFASKAGSSRFLTGALDDVRLYREALPASAIAQLYDSSANGQVDLSGRLLLGGATVTGGLVAVRARRMLWRT